MYDAALTTALRRVRCHSGRYRVSGTNSANSISVSSYNPAIRRENKNEQPAKYITASRLPHNIFCGFACGSPLKEKCTFSSFGNYLTRSKRPLVRASSTEPNNGIKFTDENVYQTPPKEMLDIIDAERTPSLSLSPNRDKIMFLTRPPPLPPISELSRPELKIAGLRLDPVQNSRSRMGHYVSLAIGDMPTDGKVVDLHNQPPFTGIPEGALLNYVTWSPDGKNIVFTVRSSGDEGQPPRGPLRLWTADVETRECRPLLSDYEINSVFNEYAWLDSDALVVSVIPKGRAAAPRERPQAPTGPRIQSSLSGETSQARTYQDLLKDQYDEDMFDYYCQSNLITVSISTGEVCELGGEEPKLYSRMDPSPDGKFLIVEYLERPYSYLFPCGRFPKRVELWSREGQVLQELEALPLAENIPIVHNSCRTGRRSISWRTDKDATLYWVEAQDGGDPRVEAEPRDIVYTMQVPESGDPEQMAALQPMPMVSTEFRCGGVQWGDDSLALVYESWHKTRRSIIRRFSPGGQGPIPEPTVLFDRYYEDVYSDPGAPVTRRLPNGEYVLAQLDGGSKLMLMGSGHRPEGKRPFVDLLEIETGEKTRIWESVADEALQYPVAFLDKPNEDAMTLDGLKLLVSRETPLEPPQYFVNTFANPYTAPDDLTQFQLTNFPHPYPTIKELQKEIIRYEREDGTPLTATLYTPPGYDVAKDGPLPTLLWAYPREFKTKEAAGQLRDSPFRFSGIGPTSPLLHLARGYAVLDGPTMPIIGEGDAEPNDTYVEQLTSSARAAVEEAVRRGVADPNRVAVGGHSYGAFMTANLLAHAPDLFCCGIAQSGAYNRTLTPFGFQAEERTIWQAPDTYMQMSPFMNADKITKPILMIHGEEDNNTGTFPMQSERFYSALKGHGAICRLVLLPHESHGYNARESILHMHHETCNWLDTWTAVGKSNSNGNGAVAPEVLENTDKAGSVAGGEKA